MEHILLKIYVRLYNACGNLMVNVDQKEDLPTQTPKKTGNLHKNVPFWCGFVTTVYILVRFCNHC